MGHEWEFFTSHIEKHYSCVVAIVKCKKCGLERGPTWIERLLNATEALSAEDAREIEGLLFLYSQGTKDDEAKRLVDVTHDYARILGGEDETE